MVKEITLVELQMMAARSELQLTDKELEKLLSGVNRLAQSDTGISRAPDGSVRAGSVFCRSSNGKQVVVHDAN